MTTESLIDGILEREGGFVDHPADRGGPTNFGITADTLGAWRRLGRPASREQVRLMSASEARAIYMKRYVEPLAAVPFDELRAQLVDIGVLSGPVTAIKILQGVLGVPVDGILGPRTKAALLAESWPIVNNAVAAVHVKRLVKIVEADASQKAFLFGWMRRAVRFVVAVVFVLLSAAQAGAQHHDSPALILGLGAFICAEGADGFATMYAIGTGKGHESNLLFAPFTKEPAVAGAFKMGTAAAMTYALYKLHPSHPKLVTALSWTLAGTFSLIAARNARMVR